MFLPRHLIWGGLFWLMVGFLPAHPEEIAFLIEAETLEGMQVLEVAGASGGKAARLDATVPQWGWATVEVGRELSPGQYRVILRLWGAPDTAGRTLLYWQRGEEHQPSYGLELPRLTDGAFHEHTLSFFANAPFHALLLKNGATAGVPGVAFDWLRIEAIPYTPSLRISAYRRALAFPYPRGIDAIRMKAELEAADAAARIGDPTFGSHVARIERWLELVAGLTDADSQVRYLARVLTTPALRLADLVPYARTLRLRTQAVKRHLNSGDLEAAAAALAILESEVRRLGSLVEERVGGRIWPDLQGDPFTWVPAPLLQGFATPGTGTNVPADRLPGPFTSEPTPFHCAWAEGPALRLASPETPFSVERSWTGAVWYGEKWAMTVSVFSPAVSLQGVSEVQVPDVTGIEETGTRDALVLRGPHWRLLVVARRGPVRAATASGTAQVVAPPGAWLWLLPVRSGAEAAAWRALLPRLPTEAVQVRRGHTITQYFSGSDTRPVALAPPLLQRAMTPSQNTSPRPRLPGRPKVVGGVWGVPRRVGEFDLQMPVAYLDNTTILRYELPRFPDHPLAHHRGINVWASETKPEDVALLRQEGANYLRLVITQALSSSDGFDAWFAPLRPILEACRAQGLKVNLDPHFLGGQFNPPFVDFWRRLAAACADYRDVLAAYDLMNEPPVGTAAENATWYRWARKAAAAIRTQDAHTPILVEVGRWGNPTGFPFLRPLPLQPVVYGVHVYFPHGFTHQAMLNRQESPETAPVKPYPAWIPVINWRDESWAEPVEWWDRWTLRGHCLPVTRWWIEQGYPPLDNGEFGVIGYAQERLSASLGRWTRDVLALNETWQASWTLYGYHGGFGWYDGAKPYVREFWRRRGSFN